MNLAVGELLSERYEILDYLGSDSISSYFRALDRKERQSLGALKVTVLIKILRDDCRSVENVRAILTHKVQKISNLTHQNLLKVFEYIEGLDYLGFAMESVDGYSLAERLPLQKLSSAEVMRIVYEVALAIEALHNKDLIHGDICAKHVFIDSSGRVCLDPLSLREVVGFDSFPVLETFAKWDRHADIYALGILARNLLIRSSWFLRYRLGSLLLSGLPAELLRSPKIRQLKELARIVERSLAEDRNLRYTSITAMRMDLEKLVSEGAADRVAIRRFKQDELKHLFKRSKGRVFVLAFSIYLCVVLYLVAVFVPIVCTIYDPVESKIRRAAQPAEFRKAVESRKETR